MSRAKSPTYPNYSLKKAIGYAESIFNADRRNPIDRVVVAKHMGYTGISGAADKAISTMMQYGLIEKAGKGEVRISQNAIDILHPDRDADRKTALARTAFAPPLFRTLKSRFPDDRFSEDALRSFLMREGFLERAISPILNAYSETITLLEAEKASETPLMEADQLENSGNEKSFGGASIGDFVQWEVDGVLQLEAPRRVRAVSDDGQWVFVEQSETGIPMDQVTIEKTSLPPIAKPPTLPISPIAPAESLKEWHEERLIDDGGNEIFIRYEGEPSVERYEFIRDYLNFKLQRLNKQSKREEIAQ